MTQYILKSFLAVVLCSTTLYAQPVEELVPISSRPVTEKAPLQKKKTTASVQLPFFDDFSYNSHIPDTTLWEDANVYINQTYSEAPPTIGVATFDGLNKDGIAYDLSNLSTDSCDVLTSRGINLSGTSDTVYLSFFWQAGGLGERPESNDSINLKFYDPTAKKWFRVWAMKSEDSTAFRQVMIPITAPQYLKDGFKFRFTSFGAQAGAFDVWNLDYIRINDQRTKNDTLFDDVAFTRPHPTLLAGFESMPWFHYSSFIPNKQILLLYYQRNKRNASQNMNLCEFQIRQGSTILSADPVGKPGKDDNHVDHVETVFDCDVGNFFQNLVIPNQEFEITAYQTYWGSNEDDSPNDTIRRHQLFSNYYALDDGSAERAYQVVDNKDGFIITKYDIAQADSIKGLYLYFLPSEYSIEDKKFSIVIYANNNNFPGALIYESDSLYTPRFTSTNFFLPYQLDVKGVPVSGPVFVGIRQASNVRLPIGFDVNSPSRSKTFYGKSFDIYESFLRGNIMMRPYLRYQPKDLSKVQEDVNTANLNIYPNPASDILHIESTEEILSYDFQILNLSGQIVQEGQVQGVLHLDAKLTDGIYVLKLKDSSGEFAPILKKIVLKK